ncbi:gamma-tubulin complex component 2, partial [Tremellales sp. Uapishka_1]
MSSSRMPSSSTVPFTPRPGKRSSSGLSLTDKEMYKYAETLASVRKTRPGAILEELERSGEVSQLFEKRDGTASSSRYAPESSFHHRPLSSRLPPAPPHSRAHKLKQPVSSSSSRPRLENETWQHSNGKHIDRGMEEGPDVRAAEGRVEMEEEENDNRLLDGVPLEVQEAWICEDLTFVLQGIEGSLIRYEEGYDPLDEYQRLRGARWRIDPSLDPSLLSLVERLLPLATYFTSVEASMELRNAAEYGMVSHALGSGIRGMLKEYHVLTAQLESLFLLSPTFTLQTLYFHLHPTLHTMSLLSSLCLSLETDDIAADGSEGSDDEDGLGGMLEELGLGGAGLKGLMKGLNATEGVGGGGLVIGGEVLGIICEREATMSGDPTAATLHSALLLHASQPYSRMLLKWISTGYLSDPFDEFMVKESGHITKGVLESDYTDEYWERRYTLRDGSNVVSPSKVNSGKVAPSMSAGIPNPRPGINRLPGGACVPAFLQPWKHKILLAGKYLNVIKECGIEVKKPAEVDKENADMVVMNEPKFYKRIEDAYIYANQTLLKLMLEEQQLIPHLRSMKHFFFLDQSEFLINFLDLASSELRKPAKGASLVKLQSLLDMAVRHPGSSSSNDPYKDDLKVTMQSQGLYEWLIKIVSKTGGLTEDGELDLAFDENKRDDDAGPKKSEKERVLLAIDALSFDYSVKFPLSLVISRKTITRYQLIFRFLLHLHHLESAISGMWIEHKAPQWRMHCGNEDIERWKLRIFSLRNRMLAFVRQILAFTTGEVLETNWRALEGKLAKVQTVDQLLRDHVDFLDTCLKQCMLTTSKLLGVYAKLMVTMSAFVSYQSSFNMALSKFLADPEAESEAGKANQRWTVLSKFEINFNHHTKLHLDAVTYNAGSENVALLALVTRLHQTTLRI